MYSSSGYRGDNFVPSSNVGSVRLERPELGTREATYDVAVLAYKSRRRGDQTSQKT